MATVVAFVSQKGGVGKSTLARARATSAVRAGLAVKTVDLDSEQATITVWAQTRDRYRVSPAITVDAFRLVRHALATFRRKIPAPNSCKFGSWQPRNCKSAPISGSVRPRFEPLLSTRCKNASKSSLTNLPN
jgi:hypothetical protein